MEYNEIVSKIAALSNKDEQFVEEFLARVLGNGDGLEPMIDVCIDDIEMVTKGAKSICLSAQTGSNFIEATQNLVNDIGVENLKAASCLVISFEVDASTGLIEISEAQEVINDALGGIGDIDIIFGAGLNTNVSCEFKVSIMIAKN